MPRSRASVNQRPSRFRQIRNWIILLSIVAAIALGIHLIRRPSARTDVSVTPLPCRADQSVTPFQDGVLYYDGEKVHCLSSTGGSRWSFPVGANAFFSTSDTHVVIWSGSQLFILDQNGNATYNETLSSEVQFARIGSKYCAAVIGGDTAPDVLIKNMDGTPVDEEFEAFSGMIVLDVGFYGEADQYMWTLAMDVYGTAINTVLNTFQVGKMNTGMVNLGEFLVYKVLYEDTHLRVFSTQQMYTYDYKAVQDMSSTTLVFGWQFMDAYIPPRGSAYMLLVRSDSRGGSEDISQIRVLSGNSDRRYTLPSSCVGVAIQNRNIYAVSSDYLYRGDVDNQRFYGYPLSLSESVTSFLGITRTHALVACGDRVYSISLPT